MTLAQATIIQQQLGGTRFSMMTGATNFGVSPEGLTFKIGRNSEGITHVRIGLTEMDLYDIEFLKVRKGVVKVSAQVNGIYADMLQATFTDFTGMYTTL